MNQCQGCQAGWPLVKKPCPIVRGITREYHEVEGGYKGEICACDRHLYENKPALPIDLTAD